MLSKQSLFYLEVLPTVTINIMVNSFPIVVLIRCTIFLNLAWIQSLTTYSEVD